VRRDSVISDIEANRPKITVCEKFSLQDNSANPHLNAVTPRTELHVAGETRNLMQPLTSYLRRNLCPLRRVSTHRSTRQDAQINYLSTLSIFMKQTTYLATLPNPSCFSLSQNQEFHTMALGQNPFNPSRTLPTLRPIQQRRRELLAYQARQEVAHAPATPNEPSSTLTNRRRPRTARKSPDKTTEGGNRHEHPRNRPIWRLGRLRRTLPPKWRLRRLRRTLPPALNLSDQASAARKAKGTGRLIVLHPLPRRSSRRRSPAARCGCCHQRPSAGRRTRSPRRGRIGQCSQPTN
jgi:hypothetical protein